jgi:hypothetical protein
MVSLFSEYRMKVPKPILTREHGSWAVLIVPIIIGAARAGSCSWNVVWFSFSALGFFLCYVPANTILRGWNSIHRESQSITRSTFWFWTYLGFSAVFFIPLLLQRLWYLPVIAVLAIGLFVINFLLTQKIHKSVFGDFIAVAGLTLGAPGVYYAATGKIDTPVVTVWLLSVLFFGCSVLYVHVKIQAQRIRKDSLSLYEKLSIGRQNIIYQCSAFSCIVLMVLNHLVPAAALIAFLPMVAHAIIGTFRLDRRVSFKHLGFVLLAHSVLFTSILVWMTSRQ